MYQTVSFYDFERAFITADRADNFSYNGKKALFEWFEAMEDMTGDEIGIELDVVAICCDFSEYKTALEALQDYDRGVYESEEYDGVDAEEKALAWFEDQTTVLSFEGGVIIQAF